MRYLLLMIAIVSLVYSSSSCSSKSSGPATYCDTTCINDTMKFELKEPDNIRVMISARNCKADSIMWTHRYLNNWLKLDFAEIVSPDVRVNKDNITIHFVDTAFAWLEMKDCITGRGYLSKLTFDPKAKRSRYTSGLTRFDKKNSIEDGLIAYFDNTFLYVQNIKTGEKQQMKIAAQTALQIDYDHFRDIIDTVNVTSKRIYARIKRTPESEWTDIEKAISFK
jgi:hypothetical protein